MNILDRKVYQANPLIEARKHMNLSELRLFVLGLQGIRPHIKDEIPHDLDFKETWVTPSELANLFGGNTASITNLKKHIDNAFRGYIEIDDEEGFTLYHIYRKMRYQKDKGLLIQFDDEIKPYLLELMGKQYTSYEIKTVFPLSSEYAWRIMELMLELQGYLNKGNKQIYRKLSLQEVRFKLNVPDDRYVGRIDHFQVKVLDKPIAEINEKTIYHVWYEPYREGRKIAGFTFWMEYKEGRSFIIEPKETIDDEPVAPDPAALPADGKSPEDAKALLKDQMMNGEGFTLKQFNSIVKKWGIEVVAKNLTLGVEEADAKHLSGRGRKQYIKAFVENDFAGEREQLQAVKDHEAELDAEKKQKQREMLEAFAAQGITSSGKPAQPKKPRELTEDELENLLSIVAYELNHDGISNAVANMIQACGFRDDREFILKYADRLRKY